MKKLLLALACASLVGCGIFKAASPQTAAYTSLAAIGNAVTVADATFTQLVVAKQIATNSVPQVSHAYDQFQALYGLAILAAEGNLTNPAPASVLTSGTNVLNLINAAKGN